MFLNGIYYKLVENYVIITEIRKVKQKSIVETKTEIATI